MKNQHREVCISLCRRCPWSSVPHLTVCNGYSLGSVGSHKARSELTFLFPQAPTSSQAVPCASDPPLSVPALRMQAGCPESPRGALCGCCCWLGRSSLVYCDSGDFLSYVHQKTPWVPSFLTTRLPLAVYLQTEGFSLMGRA